MVSLRENLYLGPLKIRVLN